MSKKIKKLQYDLERQQSHIDWLLRQIKTLRQPAPRKWSIKAVGSAYQWAVFSHADSRAVAVAEMCDTYAEARQALAIELACDQFKLPVKAPTAEWTS